MNIFEFKEKEDFILYLKSLLISAYRYLYWHKKYLAELKTKIEEKRMDKGVAKVPAYTYLASNHKLGFMNNNLYNLFGDFSEKAMSYKKFRNIANKQNKNLELGLSPLDEHISNTLSQFNVCRNWGLHIPESLLNAQKLVHEKMKHDNPGVYEEVFSPVLVSDFLYYDGECLTSLYEENSHFRKGYMDVFQQMKRDYSALLGKSITVEWNQIEVRPFNDKIIAEVSSEIQHKKFKGLGEKTITHL